MERFTISRKEVARLGFAFGLGFWLAYAFWIGLVSIANMCLEAFF